MLTPVQREDILRNLDSPYGRVKLRCGEDEITLEVRPWSSGLSYRVMTFVNGRHRGEWFKGEAPESRYLRKDERFLWSAKQRADLVKLYGGKRCPKAELERINRKTVFYRLDWLSGKAALRHMEKICPDLKWIGNDS